MEPTFEKILDQWKREGIKLGQGALPDQLRQAIPGGSFTRTIQLVFADDNVIY